MKNIVSILSLLQIIGFITTLAFVGGFAALLYSFTFITLLILLNIVKDKAYEKYTVKYENAIEELQKEKEAYQDAKSALEHTGVILGEILIEKKENY